MRCDAGVGVYFLPHDDGSPRHGRVELRGGGRQHDGLLAENHLASGRTSVCPEKMNFFLDRVRLLGEDKEE